MLYDNLGINEAGHLTFAGFDTTCLAAQYGTNLLVMDEERIRGRCRTYRAAMQKHLPAGSRPLYASKALSILQLYRIMAQEDMGIDVVSAGELFTAVKAGYPMENAYFHGSSKTDRDIAFAMDHGIGRIVCDSAEELAVIDREAALRGIRQKILLRLAPGIDPHTHEKINTGRIDSKFGAAIENGQAEALTLRALAMENVELEGFHCHVGSQIFDIAPFREAAEIMLAFVARVRSDCGYMAKILNIGGGFGVRYTAEDPEIDYEANIRALGEEFDAICAELNLPKPAIMMEPGRSIVAAAGATVYTVGSVKTVTGFRNYVSVDGGMPDNPRYTLYGSKYTVVNADRADAPADFACTLAGRCCESGDRGNFHRQTGERFSSGCAGNRCIQPFHGFQLQPDSPSAGDLY